MSCAFTGGPYYAVNFLGATEQIMVETLADCLSYSGWTLMDKVSAWAAAIPMLMPLENAAVQVDGDTFTFKTTPAGAHQIAIGSSIVDATNNFIAAINAHSATCSARMDGSNLVVEYRTGGSFGNGVVLSGWLDWTADLAYNTPSNSLWLGGYKFKTGFAGSSTQLGAIPCQAYFFGFDAYGVLGVQFMSADENIKGMIHAVGASSVASMRFIGGPAQFFLFRTDVSSIPYGSMVCGGSFYVNYASSKPPKDAWYSFGDALGSPFFAGGTPRVNYCDAMVAGWYERGTECCYDRNYAAPDFSNQLLLTLRMTAGGPALGPDRFVYQPHQRYGGDPIISDPFLIVGSHYRGQMFDAMTVGKNFASGFSGAALSGIYPWSDGSTRPDGVPNNRLDSAFDKAVWENITDNYPYGALFVVSALPDFMKGKAIINYCA